MPAIARRDILFRESQVIDVQGMEIKINSNLIGHVSLGIIFLLDWKFPMMHDKHYNNIVIL